MKKHVLVIMAAGTTFALQGCMTYVRTVDVKDSRVDIAALRNAMALQVGVQTRGQHIPDGDQKTDQEGGGRADTAFDIPVNLTKPTTVVPTATTTAAGSTNAPAVSSGATQVSTSTADDGTPIVWDRGGEDGSGAVLDTNVTITAVSANVETIYWTQPDITHWAYHDGATWSWTCAGRKGSDGKWHVGKFDWGRGGAGAQTKNTENLRNGYKGHTMFADGEAIIFGLVSTDGKQRSNWVVLTVGE
jgi:hypothetical protein